MSSPTNDDLVRDYRRIKAPPHLATRVRAEVADSRIRSNAWLPASATMLVAIAALWLLPMTWQQQAVDTPQPNKPSLSALASLKPDKPAVKAPSMTGLRSISVPKMPPKPTLRKETKPSTNNSFKFDDREEQDDAHV